MTATRRPAHMVASFWPSMLDIFPTSLFLRVWEHIFISWSVSRVATLVQYLQAQQVNCVLCQCKYQIILTVREVALRKNNGQCQLFFLFTPVCWIQPAFEMCYHHPASAVLLQRAKPDDRLKAKYCWNLAAGVSLERLVILWATLRTVTHGKQITCSVSRVPRSWWQFSWSQKPET